MKTDTEMKLLPFLVVTNALKASDFYVNAFGATIIERYTHDNRTSALISLAGGSFWIGDEEPEFQNHSPEKLGGSPVRMILQTPEPDAIFETALQAGATQICPVTIEDSWKIGKLKDPFGHIWEIGCPLP